jgi:hypothetical protein
MGSGGDARILDIFRALWTSRVRFGFEKQVPLKYILLTMASADLLLCFC